MKAVLHIVQESVKNPRHEFLGSVKDTVGHAEYFTDRGWELVTVHAEGRSDQKVLESVQALDLGRFAVALFELPLYPRTQKYLRTHAPHIRILVRPINAEFLHQLHLFRAHMRYPFARDRRDQLVHDLTTAVRRLWLDVICAWRADMVLSISDWETDHYWRWIVGRRRVRTLPYFTPARLTARVPQRPKALLCVCPLSTAKSIRPFPLDGLLTFSKLVRTYLLKPRPVWRFAMTGSTTVTTVFSGSLTSHLNVTPELEQHGFLDDPYELLAEARCVAVLSNFGYGIKTKILDAIAARCWVLVFPTLYARLPTEVRPFCQVVERMHASSFSEALERSVSAPYPESDPNDQFRQRSYAVLDEVTGAA